MTQKTGQRSSSTAPTLAEHVVVLADVVESSIRRARRSRLTTDETLRALAAFLAIEIAARFPELAGEGRDHFDDVLAELRRSPGDRVFTDADAPIAVVVAALLGHGVPEADARAMFARG
jgi:hypothetical protein